MDALPCLPRPLIIPWPTPYTQSKNTKKEIIGNDTTMEEFTSGLEENIEITGPYSTLMNITLAIAHIAAVTVHILA